jgi:transcriptional regulator with XRE-family HTH domain
MTKDNKDAIKATLMRKIRDFRILRGIGSKQLSKQLGGNNTLIYSWEKMGKAPSAVSLKMLTDFLGITPNDLYGITNKTTRTDIISTKIDLQDLLQYNDQLTFNGLAIPEDMRKT